MKINVSVFTGCIVFLCFLSLFSCKPPQNVPYFQDFADTAKPMVMKTVPFKSPVIQTDDILSITIQTIDNEVTSLLNSNASVNNANTSMPVLSSSNTTGGTPQGVSGYLVNKDGNVELPFVGKIHVAGLTTSEARDLLT